MGKWLTATGEHTEEPIPEGAHFEELHEPVDGDNTPNVMVSRRLVRFNPESGPEILDSWTKE